MGFWLMPEPECALVLTAEAVRHDDGPAFIDALAQLTYADLISSQLHIESPVMGFPMGTGTRAAARRLERASRARAR